MKDRPLISAERQVAHLAERGVRFDIMGPEDAIAFLRDKNFFFKVKAFAKCFLEGSASKCGVQAAVERRGGAPPETAAIGLESSVRTP